MKRQNKILRWLPLPLVLLGIVLISFSFRYLVKDFKNEIRTVDFDIHTMSHVSELEEEIQLYPWTELGNAVPFSELDEDIKALIVNEFEQFCMSLIWGFQEADLIGSFRCDADIADYISFDMESGGRIFYNKIPLHATDNAEGDYYFSMVASDYQGMEYLELVFEPYDDVALEEDALRKIEIKLQDDLDEFRDYYMAVYGDTESYIYSEDSNEIYDDDIFTKKEKELLSKNDANIYQRFLNFWGFIKDLGWNNVGFYNDFIMFSMYWNNVEFLQNQGKYLIIFSGTEEYGVEGQELILIYDPILGGITGCSMRY